MSKLIFRQHPFRKLKPSCHRRQRAARRKNVTSEDIEAARVQGATDLEIHDTVLYCRQLRMMNRYVDGLAT